MKNTRSATPYPPMLLLNALLSASIIVLGAVVLSTSLNIDGQTLIAGVIAATTFLAFIFSQERLRDWLQNILSLWPVAALLIVANVLLAIGLFVNPDEDPGFTSAPFSPEPTIVVQEPPVPTEEVEVVEEGWNVTEEALLPFSGLQVSWNLNFMVLYNAGSDAVSQEDIAFLTFEATRPDTGDRVAFSGADWGSARTYNWNWLRPGRCLVVFNLAHAEAAPTLAEISMEVPACNTENEITAYVGVIASYAAWYPGYERFGIYYRGSLVAMCDEEPCLLPHIEISESS